MLKRINAHLHFRAAQLARRRSRKRELQGNVAFYRQFIKSEDLVFDIGANVGDKVCAFRKLNAIVVAVEPGAKASAALLRAFKRDEAVSVVQAAITDSVGEADLRVGNDTRLSTIDTNWLRVAQQAPRLASIRWEIIERVPTLTFASLVDRFGSPKFCKIDVEGSEFAVISGISDPVPALSFEYSRDIREASLECLRHLCAIGSYKFNATYIHGIPSLLFDEWTNEAALQRYLIDGPGAGEQKLDIYAQLQ